MRNAIFFSAKLHIFEHDFFKETHIGFRGFVVEDSQVSIVHLQAKTFGVHAHGQDHGEAGQQPKQEQKERDVTYFFAC